MMRVSVVIVVLACSMPQAISQTSIACGQPSESISLARSHGRTVGKRIVGGTPTTTRAFPWTVLIKRYGHSGVLCSGVIISSRVVLTTAHCFDHLNPYNIYLFVGKDVMDHSSMNQEVYYAERVIVHEQYDSTTKINDIAFIQTTSSIYFNDNVRPACLPDANTTLPPGTLCLLAGYGDTQGTGIERRLNAIQVPIVDSAQCARSDWLGNHFQAVRGSSFCAGYADGGPDACVGDSGAPLMCQHPGGNSYYVTGLSSWGKGCGERRKPGVYTRVAVFRDWITRHVSALQ